MISADVLPVPGPVPQAPPAGALRQIAAQLMRAADALEPPVSRSVAPRRDGAPDGVRIALDVHRAHGLARELYRVRRRRDRAFGGQLFGEPAWDMLLDLFIARLENRRISVTSACIAAAVPSTTALRWMATLTAKGLVVRERDDHDQRVRWVRISDAGFATMQTFCGDVLAAGTLFGGDGGG